MILEMTLNTDLAKRHSWHKLRCGLGFLILLPWRSNAIYYSGHPEQPFRVVPELTDSLEGMFNPDDNASSNVLNKNSWDIPRIFLGHSKTKRKPFLTVRQNPLGKLPTKHGLDPLTVPIAMKLSFAFSRILTYG